LALGVESGVESQRRRLKGAPEGRITNSQIRALVTRLRRNEIFSKGYFILSGPGQNENDAQAGIDFAISADFDLAYFAIYKEFREITDQRHKSQDPFSFQIFADKLSDTLSSPEDSTLWQMVFGQVWTLEKRLEMAAEFRALVTSGFSFSNMIKYNDYHSDDEMYSSLGFSGSRSYLQKLCCAYAEFYCRPGWNERYSRLIRAGY
jgi:hypothetical protein